MSTFGGLEPGAPAETVFIKRALVQDDAAACGYKEVDVSLAGGVIAAIEPAGKGACPPGAAVIDGGEHGLLLLPGSVNCHAHSSEHWIRGLVKPLPLELWLPELVGSFSASLSASLASEAFGRIKAHCSRP